VNDGRVVIVTGAGRGLGRAYALDLARTGASVVVNDMGCALDGAASADRPAEEVVEEIRAAGGDAVANFDDVGSPVGAASIVATALDAYGRLDGLVNNAGIMRDRTFAKMPVEDFEAVIRVHLLGAGYCTHAAWPSLLASGAGRVVFISSSVGLYGGFGQANYAAAKLGVVGLMHALRLEGRKHGVRLNAVAPVGRSRMSSGLLEQEVADGLDPEMIAPVVSYLCSPRCDRDGLILEVGAGLVARVAVMESDGVWFDEAGFDAPRVADRAAEIADGGGYRPFDSSEEALARIFARARSVAAERP
jgi:NAD(P)-dependent dehydrogenase (short-subunit alcohol dehydrogenase family)